MKSEKKTLKQISGSMVGIERLKQVVVVDNYRRFLISFQRISANEIRENEAESC